MQGNLEEAFSTAIPDILTWAAAVAWLEALMQRELVSPEQRARTRLHNGEIRQGEGDLTIGRYHHKLTAEFLKAGTLSDQEKLDLFRQNLNEDTKRHAYVHAVTGEPFATMDEVFKFLRIRESTTQLKRKEQSASYRMHRQTGAVGHRSKTMHPLAAHRVHFASRAPEDSDVSDTASSDDDSQVHYENRTFP